jgi:hypothetical protein
VEVLALKPSFPVRFLLETWRRDIPDREAQTAFLKRWPCPELDLREGRPPTEIRPLPGRNPPAPSGGFGL